MQPAILTTRILLASLLVWGSATVVDECRATPQDRLTIDDKSEYFAEDENVLEDCSCEEPATIFQWSGCCESDDEGEEEDTIVTDRPDFTEASTTVGRGRVQFELGYTFTEDNDRVTRSSSHSYPELLIRIGLCAWFELRIANNVAGETLGAGGLSDSNSGLEDMYLGCKIALTPQCGWLPEMVLMPQMTVPTGHDDFTDDEVLPGLNWLYGWDVTEHISCGGSTQGNRARDDAGHFYTEFAQSFTIGYGLTDRLGAYTEWYALFPDSAAAPDTKPQHYFDGGFTYLVTNDLQLDIRGGVGLNDAADDYFVGSGLAVRF